MYRRVEMMTSDMIGNFAKKQIIIYQNWIGGLDSCRRISIIITSRNDENLRDDGDCRKIWNCVRAKIYFKGKK